MDDQLVFLLLGGAFVAGLVGAVIGEKKGRPGEGFVLGLFLGPIGWLVLALGPDYKAAAETTDTRKCPYCAELIKQEARVCKHCGRDVATSP